MRTEEQKRRHAEYMREYAAHGGSGPCSVDGCGRLMYGRSGLCAMHYQRRRLLGDVGEASPRFMQGVSPEERFWRFVEKGDGCWPWTGSISMDGYGHFSMLTEEGGKRGGGAHRFAYEWVVGPVPEGLQLDHLCRNRACVNPAHLEPVTQTVNIRRGAPASKTHCKRGHDLTDPANLKPNSRGARQCRACSNLARMERYRRLGR